MTIGARVLATTAVLFSSALLAGCGQTAIGNANSAVQAEPQVKQASGPAPMSLCRSEQFTGKVSPAEPGAGQRYAQLILTNASQTPCTLFGYAGLQLADASGKPLPTKVTRTPNPGPTPIQLAPGESAEANLHWAAVPHDGDPTTGPCQPTPAAVFVIAPDQVSAVSVPWQSGPVCGQGSIDESAFTQ